MGYQSLKETKKRDLLKMAKSGEGNLRYGRSNMTSVLVNMIDA